MSCLYRGSQWAAWWVLQMWVLQVVSTNQSVSIAAAAALQEILASKDADHSARWLAAVHFKNSCSKYWRSRLPG
jgi:hypothetical protein